MANTKKPTPAKTQKTSTVKQTAPIAEETATEEVVVQDEINEVKSEPRTFAPGDKIPCRSFVHGEMVFIGDKTRDQYRFADYGDVVNIAFEDIQYAVRRSSAFFMRPCILVLEDEVIEQMPALKKVYQEIYSYQNIDSILDLDPATILAVVPSYPAVVRDVLKGILGARITDGSFDSVTKIKAFDQALGTRMLLALTDK